MEINYGRLRSQLIMEEELRLVAYDDATGQPIPPGGTCRGNLTIGVGRNLDANPFSAQELVEIGHDGRALPITHDQAMLLLSDDVTQVEGKLDSYLPWWRSQDEIRARVLVDMCFNMGIGRLLGFKNFLSDLRTGSYQAAADEMIDSLWYKQVGRRGVRLAGMIRSGKDYTS